MLRLLHYYARFQGARGALGGLPTWARWIVFLAAVPGLTLVLLSVAAFFVSLLALLLLAVPVYRLLRALTGGGNAAEAGEAPLGAVDFVEPAESPAPSTDVASGVPDAAPPERAVELTAAPPRRQIEVRIIE